MQASYLDILRAEAVRREFSGADELNPDNNISGEAWGNLMLRIARECHAADFAIHYGLRISIANHGVLSYALMNSRTVGQLTDLTCQYSALMFPYLTMEQVQSGDHVIMACRHSLRSPDPVFFTEFALAVIIAGKRSLVAGEIPDVELWYEHSRPAATRGYSQMTLPIQFDQPYSGFRMHRKYLDIPIPSAHPVIAAIGKAHCDDILQRIRSRGGMAHILRTELIRGGDFPSQQEMAARYSMTDRTLRRRLSAEGTSYQVLMDEIRYELAKRYLSESDLPIVSIASLLGYADPANFRRRFRSWSGMTANQWRSSQHATDQLA